MANDKDPATGAENEKPETGAPKSPNPPPPDLKPLPASPTPPGTAEPGAAPGAAPEKTGPESAPMSAPDPMAAPATPSGASQPDEAGGAPSAETAPGQVNFNTRVIAGLIDALVAFALYMLVIFVLPDFLNGFAWIISGAYWVVRDSLSLGEFKGQSVGKMAMKLKVEKIGGGDLVGDWQTALVRNVALIIPIFPLIELIVLLTREGKPEEGRRLGDEWAKTRVVAAPDESASSES